MRLLVPRQDESGARGSESPGNSPGASPGEFPVESNGETRAPIIPATVKKLIARKVEVAVETGAGRGAHHADQAYLDAGATIVEPAEVDQAWASADLVVTIHCPTEDRLSKLKRGAIVVGMLDPLRKPGHAKALAAAGITAFAMELLPRISRSQSMDVLSSQANLGGYLAVILAARYSPRIFPMLITAAGTIPPAKVLVIGAGVAGLQAIATARRLGAVVEAYDIRPAVKEQVQSLGARFVELPLDTANAQTAGGYAKEQSAEERQKQADLMAKHVIASDCVIATAAIPGKAPPLLIPAAVAESMRSGSVIVDLAADAVAGRGNCELTKPGQTITTSAGVRIVGETNLPAMLPVDASQVYSANMLAFLSEIIVDGQVKLNLEDEIQKGTLVTHDGQVVHEMVKKVIA